MKSRSKPRVCWLCVALAVCAAMARGQAFVLDAGTSTLYQAQGGSVQMRGASYTAGVGAGLVGGRFVGGAELEKQTRHGLWTTGSQTRQCNLPTDLFDADHQVYAIGASLRTRVNGANLFALGGATSTNFGSPFFQGMRAQVPVGMLLLDRPMTPQVTLAAQVVVTHATTAIGSLLWRPGPRTTLALAGGSGANRPYGALSLDTTHRLWDLKAAYLYAANGFARVGESSFFTPEPVRENVLLTVRPLRSLSLTLGRQNSLVPQASGAPLRSVVEQLSANVQLEETRISASVFESQYAGRTEQSLVVTASRQVGRRVHVGGSYLTDRGTDATPGGPQPVPRSTVYLASAEESLTPRWTLTEIANLSNGQATYGAGGMFYSNFATVSLDYQSYYVPTRAAGPFEQALIVNLQINIPSGLGLHGGSYVGPDGHLLYTAEAQGVLVRGMTARAPEQFRSSLGPNLLRGCVVDTAGRPVMGAALTINQTPVFTDSRGCFSLRERHARVHPLTVMVDEFLDGGHYRVVSAPRMIRSAADDVEPESLIVVAPVEVAPVDVAPDVAPVKQEDHPV